MCLLSTTLIRCPQREYRGTHTVRVSIGENQKFESIPRLLLALILCAGALPACKTTGASKEEVAAIPAGAFEFQPESSVSLVHLDQGRYPNLYSPGSYALWVDEEVARAKLQKDLDAGIVVSSRLAEDAQFIHANYILFECRLESLFPDGSIAYDVIGLRNMDTYLMTPGGTRIRPIQTILGGHADERLRGALREFGRTNILIFAREDVLSEAPTIPDQTSSVRLYVDGFNSAFYFEWSAAPFVDANGDPIPPPEPEQSVAGRLGFSALYSKLRVLAHNFK